MVLNVSIRAYTVSSVHCKLVKSEQRMSTGAVHQMCLLSSDNEHRSTKIFLFYLSRSMLDNQILCIKDDNLNQKKESFRKWVSREIEDSQKILLFSKSCEFY